MAHHKRRQRRRGDIKGCCGLCMLRKTDGTRNGRRITLQEHSNLLTLAEGLEETGERQETARLHSRLTTRSQG